MSEENKRRRHKDPGLVNPPSFNTNEWATREEQESVFQNPDSNTGVVEHGYTGEDIRSFPGVVVQNDGSLVVAPAQSNSGSVVPVQNIRLRSGDNVQVTRVDGVISGSNELVPGGLGLSPNLLLNLPSADGMYNGKPVWNYGPNERIDALPAYQANRARLLDPLADIVEAGEYDFFIIGIPANFEDATIAWKDTYRSQVTVPPESLLVMIMIDFIPIPPVEPT